MNTKQIISNSFVLVLIMSFKIYGQEIRYFTPHFQKPASEKTEWGRKYYFKEGYVLIEDYKDEEIKHKATIYGLDSIDDINAFAWYCLSQGSELYYKDHFKNSKATYEFYFNGSLSKQVIFHGRKVKYVQVWNNQGNGVLFNGSGNYTHWTKDRDEEVSEIYKDSTLVAQYGIRVEKKDTIYYTYDKVASPKEGHQMFYQNLARLMKYPGKARRAGMEGRVYIEFVVNEKGKLTDFKPLTNEGYQFEAKTIKELDKLPNWNPAILKNRPVQSKFILPVVFKFRN